MACLGKTHAMTSSPDLAQMPPDQMRALAAQLLTQIETMGHTVETMSKTVETMVKTINRDQTLI